MLFARITGQGMSAIALSVALLWGCLIAQRVITRTAADGRARALQEIRTLRLRNRREPASHLLRGCRGAPQGLFPCGYLSAEVIRGNPGSGQTVYNFC